MSLNPGSESQSSLASSVSAPAALRKAAVLRKASIAFVLLLATLVLLGWQFDISLLKSGYPGSPSTMKANTASTIADHVTLSLGVASRVPNPDTLPQTLIQAADRSRYPAKTAGPNTYRGSAEVSDCGHC